MVALKMESISKRDIITLEVLCSPSGRFYAVNVNDLTDRPGFPVLVDGHNAENDPARYFIGGTVLQRPVCPL